MVNIVRNFLIILNNLQQKLLKLLQKKAIQKTAGATGDLISNVLIKPRKFQKIHKKVIQRHLQMSMIKDI